MPPNLWHNIVAPRLKKGKDQAHQNKIIQKYQQDEKQFFDIYERYIGLMPEVSYGLRYENLRLISDFQEIFSILAVFFINYLRKAYSSPFPKIYHKI